MKSTSICMAVLAVVSIAAAQETEKEFEGEVIVGPQYYLDSDNRDSNKFEEYRDVPNGLVLELFRFHWDPTQKTFFHLAVRDVTQLDQKILFNFGQRDLWQGTIHWSENPRQWTDQAAQLYAQSAPATFTLEDSFQSAVRAAPASADTDADLEWDPGTKGFIVKNGIAQGAQPVEVGHQRKTGGAAFLYTPNPNWIVSATADRERRTGTAPQTLGMYFSHAPSEVAAPVEFNTNDLAGAVEYRSRGWNAGVRVAIRGFDTENKSLRWDNQMFLVDEPVNINVANPGRMQMSQTMDYESDQVWLFGGVDVGDETRIDASVSQGRARQNDAFLPMTVNTFLTAAPLPASNYDGEHQTTAARILVSSRPLRGFRWNAWFRSYELDNRSPALTFADYVQTDFQFPLCGNVNVCDANGDGLANDRIARRSLPYGYRRQAAGALVGWSPELWFRGALSFEREGLDREFSAVESSHEDIWKLTLDFDLAAWLSGRTTFRYQDRKAHEYHAHYFEGSFPSGEPVEAAFNEGSRRFYWTDRQRDSYALMLDATPISILSLYAEAVYTDDHYTDPNTGLAIGQSYTVSEDRNFDGIPETYDILLAGRTHDRSTSYSLGFAVIPSQRIRIYGDYTWDTWKYGMETRYRAPVAGIGSDDPLDNWGSNVDDGYDTAAAGFDLALVADRKWWLDLDASWSRGTGDIETHFVPGGSASGDTTLTQFPELDTKLTVVEMALNHRIRPNLSYALRYWFESWKEDNFASDFNQPYMGDPDNDPGSAQAIYLGLDFANYTNHILTFVLNYNF
jgi:MtrB/PioB family decaheme-associated outer membrane protein